MKIIYEPKGRAREYADLAANLYRGCLVGCSYCYAPSVLRMNKERFHGKAFARKGVLEGLEKDAVAIKGDSRHILLSFTSDPYMPHLNDSSGITRKAIEILKENDLNIEVLTKRGKSAKEDFDLYTPGVDRFASTLTFTQETDRRKWEPFGDTPMDRIEAITVAKKIGISTWVSLEPVIDPKQTLELIRMTHDIVDLYKVGTLNYHKLSTTINWKAFGSEVVELLESFAANYILKKDLKDKLE